MAAAAKLDSSIAGVIIISAAVWPADREQRARIIGEWLQTEARFLA
jgi:hypothetical protein